MVIHCYILNTFWLNNVFSQSVPSGPIEPPKFNQGFISLNKDISRTVSQILKIRPYSRLQIKFSTTFILCKYTIFLLLRLLNSKKRITRTARFDRPPMPIQHSFLHSCLFCHFLHHYSAYRQPTASQPSGSSLAIKQSSRQQSYDTINQCIHFVLYISRYAATHPCS